MNNDWGDMSAAREFQEQVRHGNLRDDRGRRGGQAAGRGVARDPARGNYHPVHTDNLSHHGGRSGFANPVRASPASTTGNVAGQWGAKLATEPPTHLFASRDTDAGNSSPSTAPENRGEPMNVDEQPRSPEPGLGNSRWSDAADSGAVVTTTTTTPAGGMMNSTKSTASTITSGRHNWPQSASAPHTVNVPRPASPGHGLVGSSWFQPISAAPQPTSASIETSDTAASQVPRTVGPTHGVKQSTNIPVTTVTAHLDTSSHAGDKSVTLSSPTGINKGLAGSQWANRSTTQWEATFGEDRGPVIDNNWLYTYHVADGGRIYNESADNAQKAGDTAAELLLRHVADLSAGIVRARVEDRNPEAEREALDAANTAAGARQVKDAFNKYHPLVLPSNPIRLNTTYDNTVVPKPDGSATQSVRTGESAVRSCAPSDTVVQRTMASCQPDADAIVISGPVIAFDTARIQHANTFQRTNHALETSNNFTPRPAVGVPPSNIPQVGPNFRSIQQPSLPQQSAPAQPPSPFKESMPESLDDPRARTLLASFICKGKQIK